MPLISKDKDRLKVKLQPTEKSAETSINNGLFKITKNTYITDRSRGDNLKKKYIFLFNKKFKKKMNVSSPNNICLDRKDKNPSLYNVSVITNNNSRIASPNRNNSTNDVIKSKNIIHSNTKHPIKRNNSSLLIRNIDGKNKQKRMIKLIKYKKKWDLPKSIVFDKIVGRYDSGNKRFKELKGTKNYFPNYNYIFNDNNKCYVHYGNNKEILFKNLKIDLTRKLISNSHNLMNSPTNSYNVIEQIKIHEQKRKQEKIDKLKEKYGPYYELIGKKQKIQ
jgi:hypothetical protein